MGQAASQYIVVGGSVGWGGIVAANIIVYWFSFPNIMV